MRKHCTAALLGLLSLPVYGKSLEIKNTNCPALGNCQQQFQSVSEDLVAAIDYKAVGPAEATGLVGFGVGVVGGYMPVDVKGDWATVTGENFSGLALVGLQVTKGLPLGIDVGAFYSKVPDTDVKIYGGEVRFAILKGSTVSPALALRGSYVTVEGIDSFDLRSRAVDLSLSKGFALITPYVGVGYVFGESDPHGFGGLQKVDVEETKAYIGARISAGLLEITPELGQIGDNTLYNLRLGFSFSL